MGVVYGVGVPVMGKAAHNESAGDQRRRWRPQHEEEGISSETVVAGGEETELGKCNGRERRWRQSSLTSEKMETDHYEAVTVVF